MTHSQQAKTVIAIKSISSFGFMRTVEYFCVKIPTQHGPVIKRGKGKLKKW